MSQKDEAGEAGRGIPWKSLTIKAGKGATMALAAALTAAPIEIQFSSGSISVAEPTAAAETNRDKMSEGQKEAIGLANLIVNGIITAEMKVKDTRNPQIRLARKEGWEMGQRARNKQPLTAKDTTTGTTPIEYRQNELLALWKQFPQLDTSTVARVTFFLKAGDVQPWVRVEFRNNAGALCYTVVARLREQYFTEEPLK